MITGKKKNYHGDKLFLTKHIGARVNEIGMDTLSQCVDKNKFKNHEDITYEFNSNGFRDREWPNDLNNKNWAIGDSYSVGIGQHMHHTWVRQLEQISNSSFINCSEDGCSNDRMCERIEYISREYKPKNIVVMWSFFARRYHDGKNVHHLENNHQNDLLNFKKNFINSNNAFPNLINSIIPNALVNEKGYTYNSTELLYVLKNSITEINKDVIIYDKLDTGRDGFHFGEETCRVISKKIFDYLKDL
jgi:hypothetical protein